MYQTIFCTVERQTLTHFDESNINWIDVSTLPFNTFVYLDTDDMAFREMEHIHTVVRRKLDDILLDMYVPTTRFVDLEWLYYNLGIYNSGHINYNVAMCLVKFLLKS